MKSWIFLELFEICCSLFCRSESYNANRDLTFESSEWNRMECATICRENCKLDSASHEIRSSSDVARNLKVMWFPLKSKLETWNYTFHRIRTDKPWDFRDDNSSFRYHVIVFKLINLGIPTVTEVILKISELYLWLDWIRRENSKLCRLI